MTSVPQSGSDPAGEDAPAVPHEQAALAHVAKPQVDLAPGVGTRIPHFEVLDLKRWS